MNYIDKKLETLKKISETLEHIGETLVPWWNTSDSFSLGDETESTPNGYLNGYYLFPLREFIISTDCTNISEFINRSYRTLLSAANLSSISIMITINSSGSKNNIYIGLRSDEEYDDENDKICFFESIINGIFPGKEIKYDPQKNLSNLNNSNKYGGLITGIPSINKNNENDNFNISSIIRSLYGKQYTLSIIAKPIDDLEKKKSIHELIGIRDRLHMVTNQKITEGQDEGSSIAESTQEGHGSSSMRSHNVGGSIGFGIPTPIGIIGGGGNYSHGRQKGEFENFNKGKTETSHKSNSKSITFEQQNGIALELNKIAENYLERFINGFNTGLWETVITFATENKISCDVIGGVFMGEIAKSRNLLLPPPRFYKDKLIDNKLLFIPKESSSNMLFPKKLASYITSEELSLITSAPEESLPGYEIKLIPTLGLTDTNQGEYNLGKIVDNGSIIEESEITLSEKDLNKHLFVCGLTGNGKTTTVKHILKGLMKKDIPFLILESAKRDYRQLLGDDEFKNKLHVFTVGDSSVSPIKFNPFYIQFGVHPLVHIDYLKAIFNASFSLYGPMPHIIEKCLHNIYIRKGWNLNTGLHPQFVDNNKINENKYNSTEHKLIFPIMNDLIFEVKRYIDEELNYKGELRDNIKTAIICRLESLCVGAKGVMFNTYDFNSMESLVSNPTILEMEGLADDDDKAFFVGLILVLISEYRHKDNPAINPGAPEKGLSHFLVIEEAHRLLKNVPTERTSDMSGNPKGKAVEVFCNVISEMRSFGQGVCVVEQIPSKISPDVIKNSNTKIVHRLVSRDDQILLGGSLGLSEEESIYLNRLSTGYALCHKEGMGKPVECLVTNDIKPFAVSDDNIHFTMKDNCFNDIFNLEIYSLCQSLDKDGKELSIKFLNSLCVLEYRELEKLLDLVLNEFKKLLVLKSIRVKYSDATIFSYFTKQITDLLLSGVYCINCSIPDDFISICRSFFNNPSNEGYIKLMGCFNNIWEVEDTKEVIFEVVFNLSKLAYYKNKPSYQLNKIIESFFIKNEDNRLDAIISKIITSGDSV